VEGEVAVRLSKDLSGESLSADECRRAIDEVLPVIELHHYVLPAVWPRGQWLIASGGMHAGFVLAETESHASGQPTAVVLERVAFEHVADRVDRWFEYRSARNKTSHTYDAGVAAEVFRSIRPFLTDAQDLLTRLHEHAA
jgi:2-keto-4-pentenoate hydratase